MHVTVRFSNVSGNPDTPDRTRDLRGMATRFHLEDSSYTDLVAITLPCFIVRDPAAFVRMNRCFKESAKGRTGMRLAMVPFILRHREAWRAMLARTLIKRIPSYANTSYKALHAFKWVDDGDRERYVRYSWLPEEGELSIRRRAAGKLPHGFLQQDLYERLGRAPARPIRFSLEVQLASQEDLRTGRVHDPTAIWPTKHERIATALAGDERPRFVTAGVLELTSLDDAHATQGDAIGFDPMNLADGIIASDDEILRFRRRAYELSFMERTGALTRADAAQ